MREVESEAGLSGGARGPGAFGDSRTNGITRGGHLVGLEGSPSSWSEWAGKASSCGGSPRRVPKFVHREQEKTSVIVSPSMARGLFGVVSMLVLHAAAGTSRRVVINNTAPRLDNTGAIIDGHDHQIRLLPNGTFVLYTIQYGLCVAPTGMGCDQTPDHCGFRGNHNITIWTSPDLSSGSWQYVGLAFDYTARPSGIVYRPDAMFNAATGLWVLWFNLVNAGGVYITCTSSSPFGPFSDFQQSNVTLATNGGGDFHLAADASDGGTGYILFGANGMWLSRLTPDYRNAALPASETVDFNQTFVEAPVRA